MGAVLLLGKILSFYFPSAYTKVGRFKTPTDILDTVIVERESLSATLWNHRSNKKAYKCKV